MRATVLREGQLTYRDDVPDPVPGPGQVLVALRACGICGSDLHFAAHREQVVALSEQMTGLPATAPADVRGDVIMGHEFSAEVLQAGPGTDTFPPGTAVTSIPVLLSTGGVETIGFSPAAPGGYAERMVLSSPLLLAIPNGLDPRQAALTEPMAVGLHAVNKSGIGPNETALVVGCGPVGIAIVAALRRRGVETIAAADYSPARRALAATMGAQLCIDPAAASPFDTVTPTVIFEAVGVPGIIDDVLRRAPLGSRIVVAGVCMQADTVHPFFAVAKELSVQFVFAYDPAEFAATLRAIAEGELDVAPLITGEVGLDGVAAAFDELADPDRHCKVLIVPHGGAAAKTNQGRDTRSRP